MSLIFSGYNIDIYVSPLSKIVWSYPASPSKPMLHFPKVGGLIYTPPSNTAPLNVALNITPNNGCPIFTKMNYPPCFFELVAPLDVSHIWTTLILRSI